MPTVLMCDFDDTVVTVDVGALILDRFADGVWKSYEDAYDRGEIGIEETLVREFSSVRASKKAMFDAVESRVRFRDGFERLVSAYWSSGEPLVIASYGVDFCIRRVMRRVTHGHSLRVYAPKSRLTARGVKFTFPRARFSESSNLKDDTVRLYQDRGYMVAYVGDGQSDLSAVQKADYGFAIRGSKLFMVCRMRGIEIPEISSFDELLPIIRSGYGGATQRSPLARKRNASHMSRERNVCSNWSRRGLHHHPEEDSPSGNWSGQPEEGRLGFLGSI